MDEYSVDLLPGEILAWIRADAVRKRPRLWVHASKVYEVESAPGSEDDMAGDDLSDLTVRGILELSPQHRSGWRLEIRAEDSVGLSGAGDGEGYENEDNLTVDAFEAQFLVPERGEVEVVVIADDTAAWRAFQRWLARRRAATAP
jgi:hypothetical protein